MAAFILTPSSRPQPLGLVPESESHAKCVNQRAGKYQLLAERPWEGNVTPAVTLEQKKQAAASPLTTLSAPSNKDRGENAQALRSAEGHFELQPWRRSMAGTCKGCLIPRGFNLLLHRQRNKLCVHYDGFLFQKSFDIYLYLFIITVAVNKVSYD